MEFAYMYSVAKFHKTPISTNKEGAACFCKQNIDGTKEVFTPYHCILQLINTLC